MISPTIKAHIKEVMGMALKAQKAKMVVPKTLIRLYLLELKINNIKVTVENENELYIDWSDDAKANEISKRSGSEQKLKDAARVQGKK